MPSQLFYLLNTICFYFKTNSFLIKQIDVRSFLFLCPIYEISKLGAVVVVIKIKTDEVKACFIL
jgi:hypothetical protein